MNRLMMCWMSLIVPLSAQAAQTLGEAKRLELEYRSTQEPLRRGGDNSNPGYGSALIVNSYEDIALGDGIDGASGKVKSLCWDTSSLRPRSRKLLQQFSSFQLVKSTKDLKEHLKEEAAISGEGTFGAFNARASTNRRIVNETQFSSTSVAIVARYSYVHGLRWLDGPLTLMPYYADLVASGRLSEFYDLCGNQYISQVQQGASLTIVYTLVQNTYTHSTEAELKAAFEAKYGGYGSVNGSGSVSQRQNEILNGYSVSSKCYADGGNPNVCRFIVEQGDIGAAWQALVDSLQSSDNLAVLSEAHDGYDTMTRNPAISSYRTKIDRLSWWETISDEVHYICSALPYISICPMAKKIIGANLMACADQDAECSEPQPAFVQPIYNEANIGSFTLYQHKDYQGFSHTYQFGVSDKYGVIRPGVLYDLQSQDLDKMVSSVTLAPRVAEHFYIEFYEKKDGTGRSYATTGTSFVGKSFNDKARSFRLIPR